MSTKPFLLGVLVGSISAAAIFVGAHKNHNRPRARLYVSDTPILMVRGEPADSPPAYDHAEDIRRSCPSVAFVSTNSQSDYTLVLTWRNNRWTAIMDGDDQYLLNESSPDFNKIIRDACEKIRTDQEWPVSRPPQKEALADRYEIHDLRNGNVSTSALLDRRTGKVWVWEDYGKGRTGFSAEDVTPSPDAQ